MSTVLKIKLQGGEGAIDAATIHAILPDINNVNRCQIHSDMFPDGLPAFGPASGYASEWWKIMGQLMNGEPEDETDGDT